MSWETMSEGGNPFRNPADGHSQPQDSDSTYEERLTYMDFSEWERILFVASHDRSLDPPPKMIVLTSLASPNSSATKNLSNPKVVIPKSPRLADNRYRRSQSQRKLCEDDELPSDVNRWSPKRLMCGMHENEEVRVAPGFLTKPSPPKRDSCPHSGLHSFSSQDQRKTSHNHKVYSQESQSQRHWYEDDEMPPNVNRWSPKQLMCGMQDNEMVHVAPKFPSKPSPPKSKGRLYSGLHSLSSQDKRKTSSCQKIHLQERLNDYGSSPPLDFTSQSMNWWREEQSANHSHSVSRRQWYERSDSMKGKVASNTPYSMEIVSFKKVGEGPPEADGVQSFTD